MASRARSVASLPEPGVRGVRVVFTFEGVETEVVVRDAALARDVSRIFPGARVEESGDCLGTSKELGSGPDGFFFRNLEERAIFGSVPDLLAAVEFAVVIDLLAGAKGTTHIHAAGTGTPHGAVLVTGPAGAGKSSIALAWALSGLPLLGDDVIQMDEEGLVAAFPRLLKVDPDRLEEGGVAVEGTPFWKPDSDEAWFDPVTAGGWIRGKSQVAVLARVEFGGAEDLQIREMDDGAGLRLLLDAVQTTGLQPEQSMDRFIQFLAGARVFDLRFVSSTEAARHLVEIVES